MKKGQITPKNKAEIDGIRAASAITAQLLDEVTPLVKPGISTEDINTFIHDRTLELGAIPAPLNYHGFPKSVCTSLNNVICHGIPSPTAILRIGDILNIDVTSIKDGFFGDSSRMFFIGGREACSEAAIQLVDATHEALNIGIKAVKPDAPFGAIGAAIDRYIQSLNRGYGIVREYTGHGIGTSFHEPPNIFHFRRNQSTPLMKTGMVFTIEPMINIGHYGTVLSTEDGWTVSTRDGALSAQWEHTVLVNKSGCEILTLSQFVKQS